MQSIAYSNDKGRTWTKYSGNPVIPNPGKRDFRDPKVIWHEQTKKWVMLLAGGDRILIYTSPDLKRKRWTYASEFGEGEGSHGGVWECPDLFELPVEGRPNETKWVIQVSVGDGAVSGGSGMQYSSAVLTEQPLKMKTRRIAYYGQITAKTSTQLSAGLISRSQTDEGFG